jgi:probable F420-dependent oxidoreductase
VAGPSLVQRREELRAALGRVGVWSFALDRQPAVRARRFAAEIEDMGFRALWIPEGLRSREIFSHASILLQGSRQLIVASGIASIWARDPVAMAGGARTLADAFPGRFVLGIGASHAYSAEARGHEYRRPFSRMRGYLDAMDGAELNAPPPERPAPVVLAALGPKMLRLAADRSAGAHPYFVPVEHTAFARQTIGPEPVLLPELAAVLERDPDTARRIARQHTGTYASSPNYANNLRRLGWKDADLDDGGSDRLVDAIVAWGDLEAIVGRVQAHLDAGADHVAVQVLRADPAELPVADLRELAAVLLG